MIIRTLSAAALVSMLFAGGAMANQLDEVFQPMHSSQMLNLTAAEQAPIYGVRQDGSADNKRVVPFRRTESER